MNTDDTPHYVRTAKSVHLSGAPFTHDDLLEAFLDFAASELSARLSGMPDALQDLSVQLHLGKAIGIAYCLREGRREPAEVRDPDWDREVMEKYPEATLEEFPGSAPNTKLRFRMKNVWLLEEPPYRGLWAWVSSEGTIEGIACDPLIPIRATPLNDACPLCDVELEPGKALLSTLTGEEDDIGGCVTLSPGGPGKLVDVLKCGKCGFSRTVSEAKPNQPPHETE